MAQVILQGGCFCGAVRYRIEGAPIRATHCHCTMCRRTSGAPFVTWAVVESSNFAFTRGEPAHLVSSAKAARKFCPSCGTPLLWQPSSDASILAVTACSLDEPLAVTPQDHIWTQSQLSWVRLDDGLPRHERWRA